MEGGEDKGEINSKTFAILILTACLFIAISLHTIDLTPISKCQ